MIIIFKDTLLNLENAELIHSLFLLHLWYHLPVFLWSYQNDSLLFAKSLTRMLEVRQG